MYGSSAWTELPDDHPDKVAAVLVAAEIWARRADDLVAELKREDEESRAAFKRAEDAAYVKAARAHRDNCTTKLGFVATSFEERRRRQIEAAKPRPGDFPGRGGGAA